LKIALVTLNTGRLTLSAACTGMAKRSSRRCAAGVRERVQWGVPIWKHRIGQPPHSPTSAPDVAMDSIARLASRHGRPGGYDIRLEAAAAKEWNTVRCWEIVDQTLQIRGGRGLETGALAAARGEDRAGERIMRDCRINLIFEGSERGHAPVHGARSGRQASRGRRRNDRSRKPTSEKLAAMPKIPPTNGRLVSAALAARSTHAVPLTKRLG